MDNYMDYIWNISGWWLTYPSEKYESVGNILPNIWKVINMVPNHQPDMVCWGFPTHSPHLSVTLADPYPSQLEAP